MVSLSILLCRVDEVEEIELVGKVDSQFVKVHLVSVVSYLSMIGMAKAMTIRQ